MAGVPDPNEAANRKIARQLFSIWSEEQEAKRSRLSGSAPAWIACALSLCAVIWNAAVISGDVGDNTRRITAIELEQRSQASDNREIIERMARIEAKLDLVVEAKQ